MIDLSRDGDVFTLTMDAGENRWNTAFVRDFAKALDEVEASTGPAALVTTSSSGKFFSNITERLYDYSRVTNISNRVFRACFQFAKFVR